MSNITTGFLGAASGQPGAFAVQADPTTKVVPASIVLKAPYWPAGIIDTRPSFADGNIPFRCGVGQSLILPYYEANALVTLGAASWM
jgi:hypothetical protein